MATLNTGILTSGGLKLFNEAQAGNVSPKYTKVVFCDAKQLLTMDDDDIRQLTDITPDNYLETQPITYSKGPVNNDDDTQGVQTVIRAVASNAGIKDGNGNVIQPPLTTGFYPYVSALFANDGNKEILYGIYLNDKPGFMPPYDGKTPQPLEFTWQLVSSPNANFHVTASSSIYATIEDLNNIDNKYQEYAQQTRDITNNGINSLESDASNESKNVNSLSSTLLSVSSSANSINSTNTNSLSAQNSENSNNIQNLNSIVVANSSNATSYTNSQATNTLDSANSYTDSTNKNILATANSTEIASYNELSESVNGMPNWNDENQTRNQIAPSLANSAKNDAFNHADTVASNALNQANANMEDNRQTLQSERDDDHENILRNATNLVTEDTRGWHKYHLEEPGDNEFHLKTVGRQKGGSYYISFDAYVTTPCVMYAIERGIGSYTQWNLTTSPQHYSGPMVINNDVTEFGFNVGYGTSVSTDVYIKNVAVTPTTFDVPYSLANNGLVSVENQAESNSTSANSAVDSINDRLNADRDSLNNRPTWTDENWTRNSLQTFAQNAANGANSYATSNGYAAAQSAINQANSNMEANRRNLQGEHDENRENIVGNAANLVTEDTSDWKTYHLEMPGTSEFYLKTVGRRSGRTYHISFDAYVSRPCTLYEIEQGIASYGQWDISTTPQHYTGVMTINNAITTFGFNIGGSQNPDVDVHIKNVAITPTTFEVTYQQANNGFMDMQSEVDSDAASAGGAISSVNDRLNVTRDSLNARPTWSDENYTRSSLQTLAQEAANGANTIATHNGNAAATNALNQANANMEDNRRNLQNQINDVRSNIMNLAMTNTDGWVTVNNQDAFPVNWSPQTTYTISFDVQGNHNFSVALDQQGITNWDWFSVSTTSQHYSFQVTPTTSNSILFDTSGSVFQIRHLTVTKTSMEVDYNSAQKARADVQGCVIEAAANESDAQNKSGHNPGMLFVYQD